MLAPKASSKRSGATKIGSQPSAISAASAAFFGPIAAREIGTSARNGRTISFSGLPRAVGRRPAPRVQRLAGAGRARPVPRDPVVLALVRDDVPPQGPADDLHVLARLAE